jgi:SAM-dependent methyltransferase
MLGKLMESYTQEFYTSVGEEAQKAANKIVPYLMQLISPKSVADVGCGLGAWLATFEKQGVDRILGVDGIHMNFENLKISRENLLIHNLSEPLMLDEVFDLAMCLEVAEHIPSEKANNIIKTLCRLSSAILFSAAIPHQPGTHHINCQWPDYWFNLFKDKGYVIFDCMRMKFWVDEDVSWWYSQNMFLLIKKSCIHNYPFLTQNFSYRDENPEFFVHPNLYLLNQYLYQKKNESYLPENISIKSLVSLIVKVLVNKLSF